MICSSRLATLVLGFMLVTGGAAAQEQFVTVCGRDDAPGGLNLATALGQPGSIMIRCPAGEDHIAVTATHVVPSSRTIRSEQPVTLSGPGNGPMFTTTWSLYLTGLTLTNKAAAAGTIVAGDHATVTLDNVMVEDSPSAFLVRTLRAKNSRFRRNGDAQAEATGSAVVNAETVEMADCEFIGNGDHPIAGGAWPTPDRVALSRQITIDRSTFAGNRASLLFTDARVKIRASRFVENGTRPEAARDAFGATGGALTIVRSDVEITDSDFVDNGSFGLGGAILALGSRVTLTKSTFEHNTARIGGAIAAFGRPPRENIWSADEWIDLPRLVISRVTFDGNTADQAGGALAFAGQVMADGVLLRNNVAGRVGGAMAALEAASLPEPWQNVFQVLADKNNPLPNDQMTLTRSIIVDNHAADDGGALALGGVDSAVGNTILARNTAAGAAISGSRLRLVNSVVANNAATGLAAPTGAALALGNVAIFSNTGGNCVPGATPTAIGPNLQSPDNACGAAAQVADPGLDSGYAPGFFSAARGAGDWRLCITDPVVGGVDLYSHTRAGRDGRCAIGAIERDLTEVFAAGMGLGKPHTLPRWLWWCLALFLLIVFLFGLLRRCKRAKRRLFSQRA